MLKLYTDAATKGNIGLGGIGILIVTGTTQRQLHRPLAVMSNHEAEFHAAIAGFTTLLQQGETGAVSFYSDSKLVIEALDKRYAKHYGALLTTLLALIDRFDLVLWQWVPDHANRGAHMLAQQGLHEAERAAERG